MEIRAFFGQYPEVTVVASPGEFADLAARLRQLVTAGEGAITVQADAEAGRSPAPDTRLAALRVRVGLGPLLLHVEGRSVLSAVGTPEAIELFARNLPVEESLRPGYHVHYERFGREDLVSEQSVPVILQVGESRRI